MKKRMRQKMRKIMCCNKIQTTDELNWYRCSLRGIKFYGDERFNNSFCASCKGYSISLRMLKIWYRAMGT